MNSLLYNVLEASRFFLRCIYAGLNRVLGIQNSKLVNVYSFASFTSFGLDLLSVDYYDKR